MSDTRINLEELRAAATRKRPPLMLTDQAKLLALVEAVEAAQAWLESDDLDPDYGKKFQALDSALARFSVSVCREEMV